MIEIVRDKSVQIFLEQAGPLLYKDEAVHSLMIGLCEVMLATPPPSEPLLLRILENNKTVSVVVQTRPQNVIISYASEAVLEKLVEYLSQMQIPFNGVVGPAKESEFLAKHWALTNNKKSKLSMGQKIYKLEKVLLPKVSGEFRPAKPEETEIIFEWVKAFAEESLPEADQQEDSVWREKAKNAVQSQDAHVWIQNDKPVSLAFRARPTKNGGTVNCVYTPKDQRKKGYASGVVAHLSQKILDSGKSFCVLYTDLANPTSNKIYQDVGYQEVADSKYFSIEE